MEVTNTVNLELNECSRFEVIEAHQGDKNSRFILAKVTQNGEIFELDGCTAKIDATLNDFIVAKDVDGEIIKNNTVKIPLSESMLQNSGILKIDLKITQSDSLVTAQTISIKVGKSVINKDSKIQPDSTIEEDLKALNKRIAALETDLENKVTKGETFSISENMLQPYSVSTEKIVNKAIKPSKLYGIDNAPTANSLNLVYSGGTYIEIENAKLNAQTLIANAKKEVQADIESARSDLQTDIVAKADFEKGTGTLTFSNSNFTKASFNYIRIENYVILNFDIAATATTQSLQSVSFAGLPFASGIELYRRITSVSRDDVYIAFSNTRSATSLLLHVPNGFSANTNIRDTIIYQIRE